MSIIIYEDKKKQQDLELNIYNIIRDFTDEDRNTRMVYNTIYYPEFLGKESTSHVSESKFCLAVLNSGSLMITHRGFEFNPPSINEVLLYIKSYGGVENVPNILKVLWLKEVEVCECEYETEVSTMLFDLDNIPEGSKDWELVRDALNDGLPPAHKGQEIYELFEDSDRYGREDYEGPVSLGLYARKKDAEAEEARLNASANKIPTEYEDAGWTVEEYHKTFGKCSYHVITRYLK